MEGTFSAGPRDMRIMRDGDAASRPRIRWGAVSAGMVLAVALLVLASSFWFALAFGSDQEPIRRNLEWYVGASAAACVLIGSFAAGRLSGEPGAWSGLAHGMTMWAVSLLVVLAIGIPSVINVLNLGRVATELDTTTGLIARGVDSSLWTTFLAIVAALVASAFGGLLGGITARRRSARVRTQMPPPVALRDREDADLVEIVEERV